MSKIKYLEESGVHSWEVAWAGQTLKIQTGLLARQADAAVTVQYGETVMLATAVMSDMPREGMSYFPLLVDYEEKFYAAGKIKGSRFIKREGRPSDDAVLSGRLVDRSIRPYFDDSMRQDVQVVVQTLSWDGDNDPDALSVIAASAALHISDIPWAGPVAAIRVNLAESEWLVNGTYATREPGKLDLLVAVRGEKAVMVEAAALEAGETEVAAGIDLAIKEAQPVLQLLEAMRGQIGQEKRSIPDSLSQVEQRRRTEINKLVEQIASARIKQALSQTDKTGRNQALDAIIQIVSDQLKANDEYTQADLSLAMKYVSQLTKKAVKELYLKQGERIDGRRFDEIRPLASKVGVLPRPHGSGFFQRGETQALTILTLGAPSDEQILDTMEENDTKKRYMHHYNFPGFSVGEVRPNRGAGRREIGHGALAEKALVNMLPTKEEFPYTIRVVSEILESNGSSSMAATCGSTLALMDAGVPIKAPVAGIAMGIITADEEPDANYKIMSDIQGAEDHYGEMDFKITGTREGVTAIQLDVKNQGLNMEMVRATLEQARQARLEILEHMHSTLAAPRPELSKYAPRIYTLRIDPEKIGDVIGPRGKIINEIIDATGVDIDIEDDGLVMVTSTDAAAADKAIAWIKDLTKEIAVGETFKGKVVRIMDFGAFVQLTPNQDGMVHVSELAPWHVEKVTDVVKLGDVIPVKVMEVDSMGRINLSLKATDYIYPPEVKALAGNSAAHTTARRSMTRPQRTSSFQSRQSGSRGDRRHGTGRRP